jgi:hypothetical protein
VREPAISAEVFEQRWAERSEMTIKEVRKVRAVRPCNCGDELCEGWQMVPLDIAEEIDDPEKPWAR